MDSANLNVSNGNSKPDVNTIQYGTSDTGPNDTHDTFVSRSWHCSTASVSSGPNP
ncbi:hypothetical protein L798_02998 [Zootermopsis nevadensis]|uniref:Uncharacterized protein n=1 Tax=Zootermopsis nevadensis TaxID=136037 RepID=A0A067QQG4_ZOONE|nr:hypothetical protein L798_02998 [Zootermopsis nevadensis]